MSAISTIKRPKSVRYVKSVDLDVKANESIKGGAYVATDASGWAVNATATTGLVPWGAAENEANNTGGGNGDKKVNVELAYEIQVTLWENDTGGTPVTSAMRGTQVYLLDNQTLTADSSGKSLGPFVYEVTSEGVWAYRRM